MTSNGGANDQELAEPEDKSSAIGCEKQQQQEGAPLSPVVKRKEVGEASLPPSPVKSGKEEQSEPDQDHKQASQKRARLLPSQLQQHMERFSNVQHKDHPILSVDFAMSSDRLRLATAGGDGAVKLWALTVNQEMRTTTQWLTTLREHLLPVNCVRWSPDCQFIASGDADSSLIIWAEGASSRLIANDSLEPWHRKWLLRGHTAEISDISWHPAMPLRCSLASCSHDGTIRLWNIKHGECTDVLRTPEASPVKGIAFDPLGEFLAAMADAPGRQNRPFALLWECLDSQDGDLRGVSEWRLVEVNNSAWSQPAPFGSVVYFRRPAWDPFGNTLCFTSGEFIRTQASTPRHFAVMYERKKWRRPLIFRGHPGRVSNVCFSPTAIGPSDSAESSAVMLAIGSQDGAVSIWCPGYPRPLVYITRLVGVGCIITDMAWAPDGSAFAYSSNDGTVSFVQIHGPNMRWSLHDMQQWRQRRYKEIVQPFLDLPINSEQIPDFLTSTKRSLLDSRDVKNGALAESFAKRQKLFLGADGQDSVQEFRVNLEAATDWEQPLEEKIPGLPPPARRRSWLVKAHDGNLELFIDQQYHRHAAMTIISLKDNCMESDVWRRSGDPCKWKCTINGSVRCAAVNKEVVALAVEGGRSVGNELQLRAAASGLPIAPQLSLEASVVQLQLLPDRNAVMVIDERCHLYVWTVAESLVPRLVIDTVVPLPRSRQANIKFEKVDFIQGQNGHSAPVICLENGSVLAFCELMDSWLRVDENAYTQSPLQCHYAPKPPKFKGKLSEILWRHRRPQIDYCLWTKTSSKRRAQLASAAHRAQLQHRLSVMALFGTAEEHQAARQALASYEELCCASAEHELPSKTGGSCDQLRGAPQGAEQGAQQGALQGDIQGDIQGALQGAQQSALQDVLQGAIQGATQGALQGALQGGSEGASQGALQGALQHGGQSEQEKQAERERAVSENSGQ